MKQEDVAPYPEGPGYAAIPSFVKGNPLNNDYYVEQFKDDEWYPVILKAHKELSALFPGYNIDQIKEKFGGLRYYVSPGSCPEEKWDYEKSAKIIRQAEAEAAEISEKNRNS